jgi:hypothetical protein
MSIHSVTHGRGFVGPEGLPTGAVGVNPRKLCSKSFAFRTLKGSTNDNDIGESLHVGQPFQGR